MGNQFPYKQSEWCPPDDARAQLWLGALNRTGPENVRAIITHSVTTGSAGNIGVGSEAMTKGFAQEWLAWHDTRKSDFEAAFRRRQIFWTRWAALAASVMAIVAVIGWVVTFIYRK